MYVIYIKRGDDTSKVVYQASGNDASCVKQGTEVTIVLEPEYLQANNCIVPKLNEKYKFSVQLQKYPMSYLTGNAITDYLISSKESKPVEYTPTAIWKSKPSIQPFFVASPWTNIRGDVSLINPQYWYWADKGMPSGTDLLGWLCSRSRFCTHCSWLRSGRSAWAVAPSAISSYHDRTGLGVVFFSLSN